MASVLITGKNSFIGENFSRLTVNKITMVVSLIDTHPCQIDFSGVDVVLHLAAIVHVSKKINEAEYYRVNRDLAVEVASAAKSAGVKHFIFLSTTKVYGKFSDGSEPWTESSKCDPADPYGKSKYEAETELQKLDSPDFTVSVIRTPVVYGPGMKANMLKIANLVKRFPVLPFAGIDNMRHYCFVENLTGYIDRIIERRMPGVFLTGDREGISTSMLVKCIAGALDRKVYLFRIPGFLLKAAGFFFNNIFDRLFGSFRLDNSNTLGRLDYNPPYSTCEGLQKTLSSPNNQ